MGAVGLPGPAWAPSGMAPVGGVRPVGALAADASVQGGVAVPPGVLDKGRLAIAAEDEGEGDDEAALGVTCTWACP